MDLTALRGIAKARWWVLVAAAVIAVVISGRLTEYRNDNLPEFQALTWVTYIEDPQGGLDRGDFVAFLESQFALAQDVNSSLLNDTPGAFLPWLLAEVDLEADQNQVHFIGRGFTQDEADQMALAMRENFLASSTIGAGQERMSEELEEVTSQINQLRAEINAQQADLARAAEPDPLTAADRANQIRVDALQTRMDTLRAHYGNLGLELINPSLSPTGIPRTQDAIQTEMNQTLEEMTRLNEVIASIPVVDLAALQAAGVDPLAQVGTEELQLDTLRLQQLEARWQQLYQTERELRALATVGPLVAEETSLDPASPRNNQAVALVGTLVAVMVGLVVLERGRGMLWSAGDLDEGPATLVELPPRPLSAGRLPEDQLWYLTAPGGRRKTAVQKLRSQLEYEENAVIAFQGSGVPRDDIMELTIDVAAALAVSDRSILMIDASFRPPVNQGDAGSDSLGPTLTELLGLGGGDRQYAMAEYRSTLVNCPEYVPGLRVVRPGNGAGDPADVLAGERFELLVEVARDLFDLVLVSGGSVTNPAAYVLAQRVDSMILVGSVGHTAVSGVEQTAREFELYRGRLLGIVLLRRRRSRILRWASAVLPTQLGRLFGAVGRGLGKFLRKSWELLGKLGVLLGRGARATGQFIRRSFQSARHRLRDRDQA